jgi:hypothetical protein
MRPRTVRAIHILCLGGASLAAGYLWAVVFGHGLRGFKDPVALNNSSSYPDADAAFVGALGTYVGGLWGEAYIGRVHDAAGLKRWLIRTVAAGAVLFAGTRVFA